MLLRLTATGSALLRKLSALHRQQLKASGPSMVHALSAILDSRDDQAGACDPRDNQAGACDPRDNQSGRLRPA